LHILSTKTVARFVLYGVDVLIQRDSESFSGDLRTFPSRRNAECIASMHTSRHHRSHGKHFDKYECPRNVQGQLEETQGFQKQVANNLIRVTQ